MTSAAGIMFSSRTSLQVLVASLLVVGAHSQSCATQGSCDFYNTGEYCDTSSNRCEASPRCESDSDVVCSLFGQGCSRTISRCRPPVTPPSFVGGLPCESQDDCFFYETGAFCNTEANQCEESPACESESDSVCSEFGQGCSTSMDRCRPPLDSDFGSGLRGEDMLAVAAGAVAIIILLLPVLYVLYRCTNSHPFVCSSDEEYRDAGKVKARASLAPAIFFLLLMYPLYIALVNMHNAFDMRDQECLDNESYNKNNKYVLAGLLAISIFSSTQISSLSQGTAAYFLTAVCIFGGYAAYIMAPSGRCWDGRDMGPVFWCCILLFLFGAVLPDVLFRMRRPASFKFTVKEPTCFSKVLDWATGETVVVIKAVVDFIIAFRELVRMPATNIEAMSSCNAAYEQFNQDVTDTMNRGDTWTYNDALQAVCNSDSCDPSQTELSVRIDRMYSQSICTVCDCDFDRDVLSMTPITMTFLAFIFMPIIFLIIVNWKSHRAEEKRLNGTRLSAETSCSWLFHPLPLIPASSVYSWAGHAEFNGHLKAHIMILYLETMSSFFFALSLGWAVPDAIRLEALISLFFLPYSWTSIRLKLLQARDRFAQFEQATANRSTSQPTPLYVIDCDGRFSEEDFEHLYKVQLSSGEWSMRNAFQFENQKGGDKRNQAMARANVAFATGPMPPQAGGHGNMLV